MTESLLFLNFLTCKRRLITPAIAIYIMPCTHTNAHIRTKQLGTFHKSGRGHDPLLETLVVKSVSEFRICIYYIFHNIPSSLLEALCNKTHYISAAKMSRYSL